MGFMSKHKSIAELEEEREQTAAEVSVLQQRVLKKELEARGATVESFRGVNGRPMWDRIKNWVKSH